MIIQELCRACAVQLGNSLHAAAVAAWFCLLRFIYDYEMEICSVRRKDFYALTFAHSVLTKFIPALCHESDGLILQVYVSCANSAAAFVAPYLLCMLGAYCALAASSCGQPH